MPEPIVHMVCVDWGQRWVTMCEITNWNTATSWKEVTCNDCLKKKPQMTTFPKDILLELRRQGFKRTYQSVDHMYINGKDVVGDFVEYTAKFENRELSVQLFGTDNTYRVSHALNGIWSTIPTGFCNRDELVEAIEHEKTRTDHR